MSTFQQPFEEMLEALRLRLQNLIPTAAWDDLWGNEHDRGFMVAGAMEADLLSDMASAVESFITEGQSIEAFRAQFDEIVERYGWDYTGARDWRTRVIYQTNTATTYAAGRLAQLNDPELQSVAPFWMYRHGGSADPRPQHLAWDGLVLPADDPWWSTHYPPNDWGCSCYVIAVSRETAARMGGRFETPGDDQPGAVGEGWDYMPGRSVRDEIRQTVDEKARDLPPSIGEAFRDRMEEGRP
jgi:uncharacterized protein with gpF-like domain